MNVMKHVNKEFKAIENINENSHQLSFDIETVSYVEVNRKIPTMKDLEKDFKDDRFARILMEILATVKNALNKLPVHMYDGKKCWSLGDVNKTLYTYHQRALEVYKGNEGEKIFFYLLKELNDSEGPFYLKPAGCEMYLGTFTVVSLPVIASYQNDELIDYMESLPLTTSTSAEITVNGETVTECKHLFTTNDQVSEFLSNMMKYSARNKSSQIVTAHNMNYEWIECLRHTQFFVEAARDSLYSVLRGDGKDQVKSIDVYETAEAASSRGTEDAPYIAPLMSFRDSMKFSGGSLKKAGKKYGHNKLNPEDEGFSFDTFFDSATMQKEIDSLIAGEEASDEMYRNCLKYNIVDTEIPVLIMADAVLKQFHLTCTNGYCKKPSFPVSPNQANANVLNKNSNTTYAIYPDARDYITPLRYTRNKQYVLNLCQNKKQKMKATIGATFAGRCKRINQGGKDRPAMITAQMFKDVIRPASGGGMVGINPFCTGVTFEATKEGDIILHSRNGDKIVRNHTIPYAIRHIDLNSAHPSQVFKRWFPDMQFSEEITEKSRLEDIERLLKQHSLAPIIAHPEKPFTTICPLSLTNIVYKPKRGGKGTYPKNVPISGIGEFTLTNVRIKVFDTPDAKTCIPCMSIQDKMKPTSGDDPTGALDEFIKHMDLYKAAEEEAREIIREKKDVDITKIKTLRGKIYKTDKVKKTCTFETLLIWREYYDFDFTLNKALVYEMTSAPEKIAFDFSEYALKKVVYKNITKLFDKNHKRRMSDTNFVKSMEKHKDVLRESDYNYGITEKGDYEFWKEALAQIKGIFNGLYGMNYQSMFKTIITWDTSNGYVSEKIEKSEIGGEEVDYTFKNEGSRDYMVSMYIALWSYVDLALHLKYVIENNGTPIYWATDSIFAAMPRDLNIKNLFNTRNSKLAQIRPIDSRITWGKDLGGMDEENVEKAKDLDEMDEDLYKMYEDLDEVNEENIDEKPKLPNIQKFIAISCLKNAVTEFGSDQTNITYSGAPVEVLFDDCGKKKDKEMIYSFDKVAERLTTMDYYVSGLRNTKRSKQYSPDGTFILFNQGYIHNDARHAEVVLSFALGDSTFK